MQSGALAVHQLLALLRDVIEQHEFFSDLWIHGEVSNYSRSSLGHRYFSLKDDRAVIRCVLFRDDMPGLELHEGDHVFAHGRVGIYLQRGELQFKPDFIRPEGIGLQAARFEQLKQRLGAEGLFEESRKRPLPRFPLRIGLATSRTGAALHDVQSVLTRRWPMAELVVAPTLVQGEQASARIVAALDALTSARPAIDVAILARGGGSAEDLWPFNDERVARALFAFPVPVVTGIGHETDVTIADFVADMRAPTPSAAAERVAPDGARLSRELIGTANGMAASVRECLSRNRRALEAMSQRVLHSEPPVRDHSRALASMSAMLAGRLGSDLEHVAGTLQNAESHLAAVNPYAVLRRGFAIVQKEDARRRPIVTSVRRVRGGDRLAISVGDGAFWAEVR